MQIHAKTATCLHCGQNTDVGLAFCCAGCHTAYDFLAGHGLQEYYDLRRCEDEPLSPPQPHQKNHFRYCDDPQFLAEYSPDGYRLTFYIKGLHCASCLWLLEKLPDYCADAAHARLDFSRSLLVVKRSPLGSFATIAETLAKLGYTPSPLKPEDAGQRLRQREERSHLLRLGISGAGAGNIMLLALANYAGATALFRDVFTWSSVILAAPVLTFCAWPLYQRVWQDLRARRISLDVPIVLAILSGVVVSVASLITGQGELYFDSLTSLVFLMTASRYLLRRIQSRSLDSSAHACLAFVGTIERRHPVSKKTEFVSSLSLQPGDRIRPQPLQTLPVDGLVVDQPLWVDLAVLTGESAPVELRPGSRVEAGMKILEGHGDIEVTATGADTCVAKLFAQADLAAKNQPDWMRVGDQVGRWFTFIVLTVAVSLIAFFLSQGQGTEGLYRALTLIIVTCPCVFGMGIPLAYSLALKNAARQGLLIKNSETFERLMKIRSVYFDKTGTLTLGKMAVTRVDPPFPAAHYQRAVFILEKDSSHPVSIALQKTLCPLDRLPLATPIAVENLTGGGRRAKIGSQVFELKPLRDKNASVDFIQGTYGLFCNETLVVKYEVQDEIRKDAAAVVATLKKLKLTSHILSGDHENAVRVCARLSGISKEHAHSSLSPADKIQALKNQPGAMMVGDGANDAGALAAAPVGVAVHGAMDVSLKSASVYFLKPDLTLLPELFRLAAQVRRVIFMNLTFSTLFNIGAAVMAITGQMSPLVAAILMPLSSLTILIISTMMSRLQVKK